MSATSLRRCYACDGCWTGDGPCPDCARETPPTVREFDRAIAVLRAAAASFGWSECQCKDCTIERCIRELEALRDGEAGAIDREKARQS